MGRNYLKIVLAITAVILVTGLSASAAQPEEGIESTAKQSYVFKTYLKDDNIAIQNKDGEVTLTGKVSEENHKIWAKEIVANLPGVKNVDNQLVVNGENPPVNSDDWIIMQVKDMIFYNRNTSSGQTQVSSTNGIVTLKGKADSQAQKDLMDRYVKDLKSVNDVRNDMTVASKLNEEKDMKEIKEVKEVKETKERTDEEIDDVSVTATVKLALSAHRLTSGIKAVVETKNGVVTLSGQTAVAGEKDAAAKVTRDVKGVTNVINNITIGK
ncbi:MAG: BON domain-containing protein [Candidatus Omnitrophica bacterium]|nr:BON domain-containing protein [Candidatus Omnitrophota bacterium]